MKKLVVTMIFVGVALLNAQVYTGVGTYTAESKQKACSEALAFAKGDAMEQAGTLIFSKFNSTTADKNGKVSKENQHQLIATALGVAKLKHKHEDVKTAENYQFTCSITASFDIDPAKMEKTLKEMMQKRDNDKQSAKYFTAEGYSENGQSRYKAFSAAKLNAQRNLLEVIKGAEITSLTTMNKGVIEKDKVGKLVSGKLQSAEVVKKKYDEKTKSAYVLLRIKKEFISKILKQGL